MIWIIHFFQCPLLSRKKHVVFYLKDKKDLYSGRLKIELESRDHPAVQNFLALCLGYSGLSFEKSFLTRGSCFRASWKGGSTKDGIIPNVIENKIPKESTTDYLEGQKGDIFQLWSNESSIYSAFMINMKNSYVTKNPKFGKVVEGLDFFNKIREFEKLIITKCGFVVWVLVSFYKFIKLFSSFWKVSRDLWVK